MAASQMMENFQALLLHTEERRRQEAVSYTHLDVYKRQGCIIGKDYPEPMVNHQEASYKNREVSKYYIEYICTLFNHFFKSLLKKLLLK